MNEPTEIPGLDGSTYMVLKLFAQGRQPDDIDLIGVTYDQVHGIIRQHCQGDRERAAQLVADEDRIYAGRRPHRRQVLSGDLRSHRGAA